MPTSAPSHQVEDPTTRDAGNEATGTDAAGDVATAPAKGLRRLDRGILILISITVVGVLLRLWGIWWGLPADLHPDEPVIVRGALDLAQRHSFEPSVFFRPDHVEIQLSYIAYEFYAKLFFHMHVAVAYAAHPGNFLLISRLVTLVFGVAMIVIAYFIGREFDRTIGLVAAFLVALLPPFVEHSHYATPDVPLTAVMMGLVLASIRYIRNPGLKPLLVASLMVSISIAIKYPGAFGTAIIALVVIVMAIRDRQPWRILKHGIIALVAVVVFLFFISPVLFTDFPAVEASIMNESRAGRSGTAGDGLLTNLAWYFADAAGVLGVLLVIAAVIGLVLMVRARSLVALPLFVSLVFYVGLSIEPIRWERWSLPMFIGPVIFASIGLVWAVRAAPRVLRSVPIRRTVIAVVSVAIVSNLFLQSAAIDSLLSAPNDELALKSQFAKLGITKQNAIYEGYTPLDVGGLKLIFANLPIRNGAFVPPAYAQWVVTSSCVGGRFYADNSPAYAKERSFYKLLDTSYPVVLSRKVEDGVAVSGLEPVNVVRSIQTISGFASAAQAGCAIKVYSITTKP